VQLCVSDIVSSVTTPVKRLSALKRVGLKRGEKKKVRFEVSYERLALVNRDCEKVVEPGEFEVMAGGSSRDEDLLKARFMVM
jgi:beta-glucosidase